MDDDRECLSALERELGDRYSRDYRIVCTPSADDALAKLESLAEEGEEVALVLAGQWLPETTGSELLGQVRRLHPHAKRGLLITWGGWGDPATGEAIFDSMAHGRIDYYVLRPSGSPDEIFHQTISSFLLEWARDRRVAPHTIRVVGEVWSGRAYELREVLGRCAIPHSFCLADSDGGRGLLAGTDSGSKLPLVILPNGKVLADPTNSELAHAAGASVDPEHSDFDLVIVGSGPAGLSAAVYGASEGFSTLVIDEGGIGGQATSSSLIRNYLGFPGGISGGRLAEQAYEQAWVLGAKFAFMQQALELRREDDRICVSLSGHSGVHARAVILATGASYRRLGVPELEAMNGAGVFYGGPASEAPAMAGHEVYVLGGANSAGQAALHLARFARRVTLVVRAESLAVGMSHYLAREVQATPNVEVRLGTEITGGGGEDGWLDHLVLRDRASAQEETVPAVGLFLMIGARPHTDWLPAEVSRDQRGFILTGADLPAPAWPLERSPFALETSMPGVLAAGDARHGSVKRVASAVGEGSMAIQFLHGLFAADPLPAAQR
ncbi:MAG TPA: FAD-dependent oxidoreductase [Thermoleophilaceae bacterium]|nr:FAD-dependent oxidoreductase [Thermoleophilaceae bacterium]